MTACQKAYFLLHYFKIFSINIWHLLYLHERTQGIRFAAITNCP